MSNDPNIQDVEMEFAVPSVAETTSNESSHEKIDHEFWRKLLDALTNASENERMQTLMDYVVEDRIVGKFDDVNFTLPIKEELRSMLEPLFNRLNAEDMAHLDENARGRLLHIRNKFKFSQPIDRVFGEKGTISTKQKRSIAEKTKIFIDRISQDDDLVDDLNFMKRGVYPEEWGDEKKEAIRQKLTGYLTQSYGVKSRTVIAGTSEVDLAEVNVKLYPPPLIIHPRMFNQGGVTFLTIFAHEGRHIVQGEGRYDTHSKQSTTPELNLEYLAHSQQVREHENSDFREADDVGLKINKYGLNINGIPENDKPSTYDYKWETNSEREGFLAEFYAAIWTSKSGKFPKSGQFLGNFDPMDTSGDLLRTVGIAIENKIGLSLEQIILRPSFVEPLEDQQIVPAVEAMAALTKLKQLVKENSGVRDSILNAFESALQQFPRTRVNQNSIDKQIQLIRSWCNSVTLVAAFGKSFVPPSTPKALSEAESTLEKAAATYSDDLSRRLLIDMACKNARATNLKKQIEEIILAVPPYKEVDREKIRERIGSEGELPIPRAPKEGEHLVPFYQRGQLCLAEATNQLGGPKTKREIVVLYKDDDYLRVGKTQEEMDNFIMRHKGRRSGNPGVLKVTQLPRSKIGPIRSGSMTSGKRGAM